MVKHVQNATSPVSPPNKQHGCSTSLVKLVSPGKVLQIILYLGGEKKPSVMGAFSSRSHFC